MSDLRSDFHFAGGCFTRKPRNYFPLTHRARRLLRSVNWSLISVVVGALMMAVVFYAGIIKLVEIFL